jgi:predicted nucleotidyltransferase
MNVPEDFKEFIELLNEKKVNYLIIGGYAVGFYSRPKFTNDIDIWIENSEENAEKVMIVLNEFGFGQVDITINDLKDADKVIQLGHAPIRIDIITGLTGMFFSEAYAAKVKGNYLGTFANFISYEDLIKSKKLAGRKKDLDDVQWLKKYSPYK